MPRDHRFYINYDRRIEMRARRPSEQEVAASPQGDNFIFLNAFQLKQDGHLHLTRMRTSELDTTTLPAMLQEFKAEHSKSRRAELFASMKQYLGSIDRPGQLMAAQQIIYREIDRLMNARSAPGSEYFVHMFDQLADQITQSLKSMPPAYLYKFREGLYSLELDNPVHWKKTMDTQLGIEVAQPVSDLIKSRKRRMGDKKPVTVHVDITPDEGRRMLEHHLPNLPEIFAILRAHDRNESVPLPIVEEGDPEKLKVGRPRRRSDEDEKRLSSRRLIGLLNSDRDEELLAMGDSTTQLDTVPVFYRSSRTKDPRDRIIITGNDLVHDTTSNSPKFLAYLYERGHGGDKSNRPYFLIDLYRSTGEIDTYAFRINIDEATRELSITHSPALSPGDSPPGNDDIDFVRSVFRDAPNHFIAAWNKSQLGPQIQQLAKTNGHQPLETKARHLVIEKNNHFKLYINQPPYGQMHVMAEFYDDAGKRTTRCMFLIEKPEIEGPLQTVYAKGKRLKGDIPSNEQQKLVSDYFAQHRGKVLGAWNEACRSEGDPSPPKDGSHAEAVLKGREEATRKRSGSKA